MASIKNIISREIQIKDLNLISAYWASASEQDLIAMGANIKKMPSRGQFKKMIRKQIDTPLSEKKSYALIWEFGGKQIGHTNVNRLTFGKEAHMHLHIWNKHFRKRGIGSALVDLSIPIFFENLKLKTLWCEPYAHNPAPNKTLLKLGFKFVKKYNTIPGYINFRQDVNQYKMTKGMYKDRYNQL